MRARGQMLQRVATERLRRIPRAEDPTGTKLLKRSAHRIAAQPPQCSPAHAYAYKCSPQAEALWWTGHLFQESRAHNILFEYHYLVENVDVKSKFKFHLNK